MVIYIYIHMLDMKIVIRDSEIVSDDDCLFGLTLHCQAAGDLSSLGDAMCLVFDMIVFQVPIFLVSSQK